MTKKNSIAQESEHIKKVAAQAGLKFNAVCKEFVETHGDENLRPTILGLLIATSILTGSLIGGSPKSARSKLYELVNAFTNQGIDEAEEVTKAAEDATEEVRSILKSMLEALGK